MRGPHLPGCTPGTSLSKEILSTLIRCAFRILPLKLSVLFSKLVPPLHLFLPAGRKVTCDSVLGKFRMNIDTTYVVERDVLLCRYEPDVLRAVRDHVHPGMVAFDIGANSGIVSLALADRVGPSGKVYSFEPGPVVFQRLRKNLEQNPGLLAVVSPHNLGVADRPGRLAYHEFPHAPGNAMLRKGEGALEPGESYAEIVTVDDFVKNHGIRRVDFIKVDVEGMEYEVFRGAVETLRKFRPTLCYETFELTGPENFRRIGQLLENLGYDLFRIGPEGILGTASVCEFTTNTLAVPRRTGSPSPQGAS